jgi:hypothetical protein
MAGYCHKLIKSVAQGITGEFYENAARDNTFYKQFPNERQFIAAYWQHMVDPARKALVWMLARPEYPADVKSMIHEALVSIAR